MHVRKLSVDQVMAARTGIEAPFQLELDHQSRWQVEQVLRTMPGKRLVMRAMAPDGKAALLKLFFKTRHFRHEQRSYHALEKTGVNTPPLLSARALAEGGVCAYEHIENAHSFGARWRSADEKTRPALLEKLLSALQRVYAGGLYQADLHLDNFLVSGEILFVLDPASCEPLRNTRMKRENLALLLAQFQLRDWPLVRAVITAHFPEFDGAALQQCAEAQHKIRTGKILQKIYRQCTRVQVWSVPGRPGQHLGIHCERARCSPDMRALLEQITQLPKDSVILKKGNSSIVSGTVVDGVKVVVKNARNKSIWRLLRRCWRRSRASNAWYFSHLLQDAGVDVPAPVAMVERKLGPFVLESWFVSEHVEGDSLLDVWHSREPRAEELAAVENIFLTLGALKVSHGDMKATNLLVRDGKIFVIDYDGMAQHGNKQAASLALSKDKKRFLQNWPKLNIDV